MDPLCLAAGLVLLMVCARMCLSSVMEDDEKWDAGGVEGFILKIKGVQPEPRKGIQQGMGIIREMNGRLVMLPVGCCSL